MPNGAASPTLSPINVHSRQDAHRRVPQSARRQTEDLRGMIGGIDFVDLNTGDAEYWDVGIEKVLRGAARNNKKLENALQVLK